MTRPPIIRRGLTALAALLIALPPLPAAARIDPPQGLAPDAKNATLPDALVNLGIGKSHVHAANHGMKCDGAADDTASLQAAVNAAQQLAYPATSNGGGVVVLPAGFCKVTGAINITNGLAIQGAGTGAGTGAGNSGGTVIRTTSTTANVFSVATGDAVIFRDFYIDAPSITKTAGAAISLDGSGATANIGSLIEHVVFGSGLYDGVTAANAFSYSIVHNFFRSQIHNNITHAGSATFPDGTGGKAVTISDNSIYNLNTLSTCNAGIEINGSGPVFVTNNKFLGCAYNLLLNVKQGPTGTLLITGNGFEEGITATIALTQNVAAKEYGNVAITGNEFSNLTNDPTSGMIYVGTGTPNTAPKWIRNINITGNHVNNTVALPGGMIQINDGAGIVISGNLLDGNGSTTSTGISVGSGASNVLIASDNVYQGTATSGARGLFGSVYWPAVSTGLPPAPNLAFNGAMRLDQPHEGAATTLSGSAAYCLDGFKGQINATNGQAATCARTANVLLDGVNSLIATVTASGATGAADYLRLRLPLEANDIAGIGFGTASAKPLTVSYTAKASVAGDYTLQMSNGATNNRGYKAPCTLAAATATRCVAVIPGDTGGTWTLSGTTEGMRLEWYLTAGSNLNAGTPYAWGGTTQAAVSTNVNMTETNGATFEVTNVKIEVGAMPTPFTPAPVAVELARAQRHYAKTFPQGTAPAQSGGLAGALCTVGASTTAASIGVLWRFPSEMRASPTITTYNPSAANANWRNVTGAADAVVSVDVVGAKGTTSVPIDEITTAPVVASKYCIHAVADARL